MALRRCSPIVRKTSASRFCCYALSYALTAIGLGICCYPPPMSSVSMRWSNYSAKAVALIQARGIPIDVPLWNLVQENKAAVIRELLQQLDPSQGSEYSIYTPEGEWSSARFEQWLVHTSVPQWPRLDSRRLDISGDAFRSMYHLPGIEDLHALRDSVGFIVRARLPIGPDGRNRPSLFPFGTATGRNAHAKSPYNAHAGVRSFMLFPPDTIGAYLIGAHRRWGLPRRNRAIWLCRLLIRMGTFTTRWPSCAA